MMWIYQLSVVFLEKDINRLCIAELLKIRSQDDDIREFKKRAYRYNHEINVKSRKIDKEFYRKKKQKFK